MFNIFSSCREEIFLAGMRAGLRAAQSNPMQVTNTHVPGVSLGDIGSAGKGKGGKGGKGAKGWHRRFPSNQTVHGENSGKIGDYCSLYEEQIFTSRTLGRWSGRVLVNLRKLFMWDPPIPPHISHGK